MIYVLVMTALAVFISGCIEEKVPPEEEKVHTGMVVFVISDKALDMENVSSINMTIDELSVHKKGGNWTTVSNGAKTYDLLELKNQGIQELITQSKLGVGFYNEIRLHISAVSATVDGEEKEAKIPSNVLKINGTLEVKEDTTSTVTFDFIADQSLLITGEGTVIMAPVVRLETMTDAVVDIKEEKGKKTVEIKKGKFRENKTVGMDENGTVGVGLRIKKDANLALENDTIKIGPLVREEAEEMGKGRAVVTITDKRMDISDVSGIDVTVDEVAVHKTKTGWVILSDEEQTFDLIELQTTEKLLADSTVDAGIYTEIRLSIKNATVTINDTIRNVTVPPSKLMLKGNFEIKENEISYAKIDFEANKSFVITGEERIMMNPVIKLETMVGVDVDVKDDDTVELVEEGNLSDEVEIELDEEGKESKRNRTERGCKASCRGICDMDNCRENCSAKANELEAACMSNSSEDCKIQCGSIGITSEICDKSCEENTVGLCMKEFREMCEDACGEQYGVCVSECEASC